MKLPTRKTTLLCVLLTGLFLSHQAQAEKAPYTKTQLEKVATHVLVGKVQAIYSFTEREGKYEYVHKVAEVQVEQLEKGKGPERLVYVRYFDRNWKGFGLVPFGGGSYGSQPKKGDTYRFYLACDAYDGWSKKGSQDGGYNVVYTNGVQPVEE